MDHRNVKRKKNREAKNAGGFSMLKNSLIGASVALAVMLVLAVAFSWIAYTRKDPDTLLGVLSFAALYISALVGGIVSAKRMEQSALAVGVICGAIFSLALFLISLCFGDSYSSRYRWGVGTAIRASVILISIFGGFIGVHKRSIRKRKRKRS